jgi:hypothetical protein
MQELHFHFTGSVGFLQVEMLVMRSRRNMKRKTHDGGILQDIDQRQLPHFLIARIHVVRHMDRQDKDDQQCR